MKQIPNTNGYFATKDGRIFHNSKELKQSLSHTGYLVVTVPKVDGTYYKSAHRVVASTFLPTADTTLEVNHKDGNKQNNSVTNLEWVTRSYNQLHAIATGLKITKYGEDTSNAKLTNKEATALLQDLLDGATNTEIAKKYNIHSRYVSLIRHKKRWGHLWNTKFSGKRCTKSSGRRSNYTKLLSNTELLRRLHILRECLNTTRTNNSIALEYTIDVSVISRIRHKKTWKTEIDCYLNG